MYCPACTKIFNDHENWITGTKVTLVHQVSIFHILDSYATGCQICSLLSGQLNTEIFKLRAKNSRPYTACDVRAIADKVELEPSRDETDPPDDRVDVSGLDFSFEFSWRYAGSEYWYMDTLPPIEYRMMANKKIPKSFTRDESFIFGAGNKKWALQKYWIKECCETHPECRLDSEDWMPTRVLELFDENPLKLRLIQPTKGQFLRVYITLSHCWGKAHLITLTKETEARFKREIPFEELPKLYRQTIAVCRDLGVRYCWIDSLCIVQDDPDDWVHEAVLMDSVYRNSLCNIEASHSEDGNGRLILRWDKPKMEPLKLRFESPSHGCLDWVAFNSSWNRGNDLTGAPLYQRAWVMQEQLLSPRSLIFSKTQIHWVCRRTEASELFPNGFPDLRQDDELRARTITVVPLHHLKKWTITGYLQIGSSRINSSWKEFCMAWRALVADYTSRSMSFEKDKLVALAGLAAVIKHKIGNYQYMAGMWNSRFTVEYELCWEATARDNGEKPYRVKEYRAPSWSWASVEGKIWWNYKKDWDLTGDTQLSYVEEVDIETTDGTLTGPIKSGRLRIRGPFLEHQHLVISSDDPADDQSTFGKVYTLTMFALFGLQEVWGLALQRVEDGENKGCYKRLGTFCFIDDIWKNEEFYDKFYGAPKQEITII